MSSNEDKPLIAVSQVPIGGVAVQAVDAAELHSGLGVKKDFTSWAKQQITRLRLVEGRDYREGEVFPLQGENPRPANSPPGGGKFGRRGGRPAVGYWLTLDAAKHVAMMANTERGWQVREYFIECERKVMGEGRGVPAFVEPMPLVDLDLNRFMALPLDERRERRHLIAETRKTVGNLTAHGLYQRIIMKTRDLAGLYDRGGSLFDPRPSNSTVIAIALPNGQGSAH